MSEGKLKISVFTLGCKVNLYDSDAMLKVFKEGGFEVLEGLKYADVYVINTCAVTQEAEKKSRQAVARIKKINPNAKIYVCGCASQLDPKKFDKDGVMLTTGTDQKLALARRIVSECLGQGECADSAALQTEESVVPPTNDAYHDIIVARRKAISREFEDGKGVINFRTRHFIKVQDGCDNFCSYCIVPYLRGPSRSRRLESVLAELDEVSENTREVVVSGINLSAYGQEWGKSLADLIAALKKYPFRVRLGSLEVGVIDEKLIAALKELKNFCPHFHLSLQSGDDEVLRHMNRRYTSAEYMDAVRLIRSAFDAPAITTDIIVGFPTETDEQFENSLDFARQVRFSDIHVFPYSSRRGTAAGRLKPIPDAVMEARRARMIALKEELVKEYLTSQIGREQEVLVERKEDGYFAGHAPNYVKVYVKDGERNALKKVVATALFRDGLLGE